MKICGPKLQTNIKVAENSGSVFFRYFYFLSILPLCYKATCHNALRLHRRIVHNVLNYKTEKRAK